MNQRKKKLKKEEGILGKSDEEEGRRVEKEKWEAKNWDEKKKLKIKKSRAEKVKQKLKTREKMKEEGVKPDGTYLFYNLILPEEINCNCNFN